MIFYGREVKLDATEDEGYVLEFDGAKFDFLKQKNCRQLSGGFGAQ